MELGLIVDALYLSYGVTGKETIKSFAKEQYQIIQTTMKIFEGNNRLSSTDVEDIKEKTRKFVFWVRMRWLLYPIIILAIGMIHIKFYQEVIMIVIR